MFERFTERARQVVVLAQHEARVLRHNYIGTEHILLGLLREEDGLAARVLESLGVTLDEVRAQVARIIGQGDEATTGQIPFTPRGKKVLELALREARELRHGYIGTEHLLLGLVREGEGVAMRILLDFGADAEKTRNAIIEMMTAGSQTTDADPNALAPPLLDAESLLELEHARQAKEQAIEEGDFERAAALRDRERALRRGVPVNDLADMPTFDPPVPVPLRSAIVGNLLVAGVWLAPLALGLFLGWLIWG